MKVRITVVTMDEEAGMKSTHEEVIEVPRQVTKLHEMFGKDPGSQLKAVGQSVFAAAMLAVSSGSRGKAASAALMEAAPSGRVGGRPGAQGAQAPAAAPAPTSPASPVPAPSGGDQLGKLLGLDLIRNAVPTSMATAPASFPVPTAAPRAPVAGFPRGHGHGR